MTPEITLAAGGAQNRSMTERGKPVDSGPRWYLREYQWAYPRAESTVRYGRCVAWMQRGVIAAFVVAGLSIVGQAIGGTRGFALVARLGLAALASALVIMLWQGVLYYAALLREVRARRVRDSLPSASSDPPGPPVFGGQSRYDSTPGELSIAGATAVIVFAVEMLTRFPNPQP